MKTGKVFFIAILLFYIIQSCKNNVSGPGPVLPGSRDYTWTADTIKTIDDNLTLTRIWGINSTDVWAVGTSSWTALTIWHYDGKHWSCDSTGRNNNPWAIIGFKGNEVWMGNTNSTIWKYDGSNWKEFQNFSVNGFNLVWVLYFDGTNSNNIFGVGSANQSYGSNYVALIVHYDGTSWKIQNIPQMRIGFEQCKVDSYSGDLVIGGTNYEQSGWVEKVESWDGKELKEIYSGFNYAYVSSLRHQVYITINDTIYKYGNNKLNYWKDLSNTDCGGLIWCGRSEKDFFMASDTGIGHYDGADFKTIYYIGNSRIAGGYIFDNDVFFILHNDQTDINVFLHGQLK